jgi:hypothetical protein
MPRRKLIIRAASILIVIFSIILCPLNNMLPGFATGALAESDQKQVEFTPHVTDANFLAQVPDAYATAIYSLPVSTEADGAYTPSYEFVPCNEVDIDDDACYRLCYAKICYTYGDDDGRVALFIAMTDEWEAKINELESAQDNTRDVIAETVTDCMKGAGGVLVGWAAVAAADPEPVTKTISAVILGITGVVICGNSVRSAIANEADKEEIVSEIVSSGQTARDVFVDLENNPPRKK